MSNTDVTLDNWPWPPIDGEWFAYICPDCEETNGGGVISDKFPLESYHEDPYDPINVPCTWCGKGPMIMVFPDDLGPDQKCRN